LSSLSNRTNEVMKVLTIVATIFIPLTFIAGVYGMNFEYMPELAWKWGYPAAMVFMLLAALAMLWYFRRKNWL
ncbi:MAG: magnesium and cobalt transport protein CorA, partial [Bacteroidales bacterium]|nr:magnesium and cobalt transport protein CorA [Bacteroidales bacterium]